MCYKAEEHIKYTVVGCTTLAPSEHTNKYNKVVGYIYCMICQYMGLQVTNKYYEHIPEMDTNSHSTTIMWDVPVITDQTIPANRSDIVQPEKKQKTCLLIDTAVPFDSNVNTQGTEKISKYKGLEIEVSKMLNMKTKIGPVITGALGTIKKGSEPSVAPRSPMVNRTTKDHTNEHCTHHS
jgi:hypothetical protein